jgi:copper chaperone CopZ
VRDTLTSIEGVSKVEVDKAGRTATFVFETEKAPLDSVLETLDKSSNGRYKGTVVMKEKVVKSSK